MVCWQPKIGPGRAQFRLTACFETTRKAEAQGQMLCRLPSAAAYGFGIRCCGSGQSEAKLI
eukprot:3258130-Alexandrium_andersonii.AAC.1